jgi:hypothetical protein
VGVTYLNPSIYGRFILAFFCCELAAGAQMNNKDSEFVTVTVSPCQNEREETTQDTIVTQNAA